MTTANILSQLGSDGVSTGFKNRIINGAMVIDQRNAGASITATAVGAVTYTLDRWAYSASVASKYTIQQNAGSVTPPAGFSNYLGVTSLSAYTVGASDNFIIRQTVEGYNIADLAWGTSNAKTVNLSFWVRSSLTGTFGGTIRNGATDRSYPFSYSISVANTWTQISITIVGDTTGTWLTNNQGGLILSFGLGVGSTLSNTAGAWVAGNYTSSTGATSVVGTNGATFYITGAQLEVGTTATNFEVLDYGRSLIQCQRYYQQSGFGYGFTVSTSLLSMNFSFPVIFRATPVYTLINGTNALTQMNGGAASITSISAQYYGNTASIGLNVAGTFTNASSYVMSLQNSIGFSAEL